MHDYKQIVLDGIWFQSIPQALQQKLLTASVIQKYAVGESIFRKGDRFNGVYCILAGMVRASNSNSEGKEAVIAQINTPNWFGEICLFDQLPRSHDACAETSCTLLNISSRALELILVESPEYWYHFGRLMSHKIRLCFSYIDGVTLHSPLTRVLNILLMIVESYGERHGPEHYILKISQEQLAMMVGVSRQTINQILKELSDQKIIHLTYGRVEILNISAVRNIVKTGS